MQGIFCAGLVQLRGLVRVRLRVGARHVPLGQEAGVEQAKQARAGKSCAGAKSNQDLLPARRYDVMAGLRPGGVVLVNAPWKSFEEMEKNMPARTKARVAQLRPKVRVQRGQARALRHAAPGLRLG